MIKHGFQPLDDEDKGKHGGRGGALCLVGMMWGVFYLFFLITFFPDWSHSTWQGEENLMGRVKRFNGVFLRCISPKQGSFKCDNYGQSSIRLGGLAFFGCIFITVYPEWTRNSQVSSEKYLMSQTKFDGIWWRCNSPRPGVFTCDTYDVAIFSVTTDIQACRALMCVACIFSFSALLLSLMGLDCTTMIAPETKSKNRISMFAGMGFLVAADLQAQRGLMLSALFLSLFAVIFGMASLRCTTLIDNESKHKSYLGIVTGVLFFLAGVSCGAAVSWFAWKVTFEYYNPMYQSREFKYEYGACLYIGWVSMLLGACTMTATIWYGVQVQKKYYDPIADDNSFKYEYGACLYVGWISAALSLIAGIVLVVGACKSIKSENNDTYYPATTYQPVSSKTTKLGRDKTEYV